MRINQVCNVTGLTKKAIEYYQHKEIVQPKADENGYRDFSHNEVEILKKVSIMRSLGLSVSDIKNILDSHLYKEELRKAILKKQLENELSNKQLQLLEKLSDDESIEEISKEIEDLNKKKSIKERLLEVFPGFYGRFLVVHFSKFLEDSIKTEKQEEAYETIIKFLDETEFPQLSDEIMNQFEEAMDFWTDERIDEVEDKKRESIENPEKFLKDNSEMIQQYEEFKESSEYQSSPAKELMEAMKSFGKTSGYNDIFIPAMRRLSPAYEEYYQSLLNANEIFMKQSPNYNR